MTRREFIKALGVSAAAVTFLEAPVPDESVVHFYPAPVADNQKQTALLNPTPRVKTSLDVDFRVGDVFTIDAPAYYAINPVTRKSTEHLQQFVVTAVEAGRISMMPQIATARDGGQPVGGYYWPKGYGFKSQTINQ